MNIYDNRYRRIDMAKKPFGYSWDYYLWRTGKSKGRFAEYIDKNQKILDVGGGLGIMAEFLPGFVDVENYFNLDVSMEMLQHSQYTNVCASADAIPFKDYTFEYVVLSGVLAYTQENKKVILEECYRVLKHKGVLLLCGARTGWIEDFKESPFSLFITLNRVYRFALAAVRRSTSKKSKTESIYNPSDEKWLRETLEKLNFVLLEQYRVDNHVPWAKGGEHKVWRWFADTFVDPRKYGFFSFMVCTKTVDAWMDKAALPVSLSDPAGAALDGCIYVFGGRHHTERRTDVYMYDPRNNTWVEKTSMPTARSMASAAVWDDKIHVFGGYNESLGGNLTAHDIYEPSTDSWKKGCPLPAPRRGMAAAVLPDGIHLIGGKTTYVQGEDNHWVYTPSTDSYTHKAPLPTPRGWAVGTVVDGKIYIIGGSGRKGISTSKLARRVLSPSLFHKTTEVYDPVTDSWHKRAPCPVAVHGAAKDNPVIRDKIYYGFGFNGDEGKFYSSMYCYNPLTDTWLKGTPSSLQRDGAACGVVNNKLYTIGGRNFPSPCPNQLSNTLVYNPDKDRLVPAQGGLP